VSEYRKKSLLNQTELIILSQSHRTMRIAVMAIFIGLVGRALFLGYPDLIDPTESRYAVVGQLMALTGNWLTPMLPLPEGVAPYLGKPPLHFWLTALSYKLFGIDEWSTRLPGFLATIGILFVIWIFAKRRFDSGVALIACLIYLTSGMAFFLAGASVTDVTLTLAVTASIATLYLSISGSQPSQSLFFAAVLFGALSFLTKGPISLVLIWLPVVLWSCWRRDSSWIAKLPWIKAILFFCVLTAPWFILSEIQIPGFSKYFFWNENIARYLFDDYGDRYGRGHTHTYGASWVMLLIAFLPWTIALGMALWTKGRKDIKTFLHSDTNLLFVLCWALSTPLFFTLVRQLHAMYLLPAIPPLSILTASLLLSSPGRSSQVPGNRYSYFPALLLVLVGTLAAVVGALLEFSYLSISLSVITLGLGLFLLRIFRTEGDPITYFSSLSIAFIGVYLVVISSITPFINRTRSAKTPLQRIAMRARCQHADGFHQVAVATKQTCFSHYWTAAAGADKLNHRIRVFYVHPDKADESGACHYLFKAPAPDKVPPKIRDNFKLTEKSGKWLIYERKQNESE
jgi:4-amino-4-deoxy-L-arabinose transferase-like glycosyltransferase